MTIVLLILVLTGWIFNIYLAFKSRIGRISLLINALILTAYSLFMFFYWVSQDADWENTRHERGGGMENSISPGTFGFAFTWGLVFIIHSLVVFFSTWHYYSRHKKTDA
jgi:hypothetical protein